MVILYEKNAILITINYLKYYEKSYDIYCLQAL